MTHRWDYERPSNLWESCTWWVRWPIAIFSAIYFLFLLTAPWHPWLQP